ncbi:Phage-related protein [Nocardia amikacinitolerans]|uniref:Phage-related protein n=1 Tax=Nocardia amikacinitolerans TaxID=756689 RepID=A0A285LGB3_9NOCA|nr:hypothetical protein [Nocardia amikacinitolerans]SNY83998.1 Phage-related protein [Nocardia amikacinitolerans]
MTSPEAEESAAKIEVGVAYLSIVGDTDKLARSIRNEMIAAQRYARANPIHVEAHADVELRSTPAERNRFVADLNQRLEDRRVTIKVTPVLDTAGFPASVQSRMREVMRHFDFELKVRMTPDFSRFPGEVIRGLREIRRLFDFSLPIPIDLDTAAAMARAAALRQELERLRGPWNADVDVDVNRGAVERLNSLGAAGLSKTALGASAATAGIAAIGGAAGAALGAISALGVGIAALGPAAAAAGATAAVGLAGVGDAFKALSSAADSAGTDGQAQAKAVAAAQEQVATALESVESAQRNLADAQKDSRDAAADIAQAYKDAADELEDYNLKLADAALSEKEAAVALRDAEREFAKAKPEDREKAALRVERAQLRLAEAQERNRDIQEEANEAQAKGVEGSDQVVQAKDRAAQANQRVVDAERQLTSAHEQVAKAQQAVSDAMTQGSSAQDKAAQALAKLAPNAQAFVLAARELKPAWDNFVGDPTQNALFDGAADGIRDLAEAALPVLGAGMTDVAGSMNGLTKQFAAFWAAPENLEGVRAIFAGTASFIDGMGPGLQQATQGFLSLGQAFEPVANQVGAQFAGLLGQIGQSFTDAFANGSLTQLLGTFGDILQGLGEGLNPLIDGLIQIGNLVGPTIGPLFAQLGQSIQALAPALGAIGATFAETLTALMPDLTNFINALLTGLEPVLPVIGDLLQSLMTALTPLLGPMSEIAQVVGIALSQAVTALVPAIGPLGQAFAALVTAVAPLLPALAQIVAGLVQALAPALTVIFQALTPVIQQVADLMLPIFEELQPILAETAMVIGQALADAITAIAPILPPLINAWGELMLAIAPLMPELARMAAELLPPLIDLLVELAPVILKITEVFTWLITNVIQKLVIPGIRGMTDAWSTAMENGVEVVRTAKDFIGSALESIGDFFSGLGDTASTVWDGIVRGIAIGVKKVGELLQRVKIPDWVPGVGGKGAVGLGDSLVQWADQHMATGGLLRGPGTGTSDSILIAASNGEFVVNARATAANLPLLQAINSGWVPSAEFLHSMVPGFAEGGQVPGKRFAESMDSAKYLMGGFSRSSIDCSGMVAAVVNDALGKDPFSGRMSTVNEGQWLSNLGALPGLGGPGDIAVAWYDRGGGANGHTAMRLGDGTGVESRSGDGVVIGPAATDVTDPMFDKHMHIPKELLLGGDLGGPATGDSAVKGGRSSKLGGLGGSGGSGGGGTGGGGSTSGANTVATDATRVFVTNWPTGFASAGPAATTTTSTSSTTPAVTADSNTLSSTTYGANPSTAAPAPADQGTHPLAALPIPGAAELFDGPAPWYMAASPEQALANLGTQAAGLAQSGMEDVVGFFQNNWQEMLETGAGVLGMGALGGGGGGNTTFNISGTDPMSAARAVERVQRRRTLATQRSGGFGR